MRRFYLAWQYITGYSTSGFHALVEQGHVYIAQPPLYSIKSGKDTRLYARSEEERDRMVKELKRKDVQVGRFKGLGEMNAHELFETTLNI